MSGRRPRFAALALACGLVASASPAPAADVAQIDCPAAALNDGHWAALAEAGQAAAGDDDPRLAPLIEAVRACARRHGWSDAAAHWATRYHYGSAGQAVRRRLLVAAGVDLTELERVTRTDTEMLASVGTGADQEAMEGFFSRHLPVIMRTLRNREHAAGNLGSFAGFTAVVEASRRNFIAN